MTIKQFQKEWDEEFNEEFRFIAHKGVQCDEVTIKNLKHYSSRRDKALIELILEMVEETDGYDQALPDLSDEIKKI